MRIITDPGAMEEVMHRLQSLQPDASKAWGKMSVGGMVCHLHDAYAGMLRLRRSGTQPSSNGSWLGRNVMRRFALHVPMKWPQGVPTPPEVDQLHGGTPPAEFEADKVRLLQSVQDFTATNMDNAVHPIFGPMTQWEWMRWAWLHADHHLRQFSA